MAPRVAPPVVALSPPAPRPTDWRDWPQTPGDWRYADQRARTVATFGSTAGPRFTMTCDRGTRQVSLALPSAPAAITVRTTSVTRVLPDAATADGSETRLAANDPLLDAIAFSRGRFVVEQPGQPPLVLPAWAEVDRVIEDCRS